MGNIAKITATKPKAKRDNTVSPVRKREELKTIESPVDQVLHLQKTIGNRAVQRLIKSGALQAKLKNGQPNNTYAPKTVQSAEQVMQMSGIIATNGQHRLKSDRNYCKLSLGYDLSKMRAHAEAANIETESSDNAKVVTKKDLAIEAKQHSSKSETVQRPIGHGSMRVLQKNHNYLKIDKMIQGWGMGVHKELTRDSLEALYPAFPGAGKRELISYSTGMDLRAGEMFFNLRGKLIDNYHQRLRNIMAREEDSKKRESLLKAVESMRHTQLVKLYKDNKDHAANHGEGGMYSIESEAAAEEINIKNQERCINEAERILASKSPEATWRSLRRVGDALHVAQDRGAHGEGVTGKGHDDPSSSFDPDDPGLNHQGYKEATYNTEMVIQDNILNKIHDRLIRKRKRKRKR